MAGFGKIGYVAPRTPSGLRATKTRDLSELCKSGKVKAQTRKPLYIKKKFCLTASEKPVKIKLQKILHL